MFSDSIVKNITTQLTFYPQEKIHVQTDKSHYYAGENVWFRAYLIDAFSHRPDSLSMYVYTELRNPNDSVISRIKTKSQEGIYAGYIALPEDLPEGYYSIYSYTKFMSNLGEAYFFKKQIYVNNAYAKTLKTNVNFEFSENGKSVSATISIVDNRKKQKIDIQKLKYILRDNRNLNSAKIKDDSTAIIKIDLSKDVKNEFLYIELNSYKKFIPIPSPRNDFDISVLPEGGYLINDVLSCVAFKALQKNGSSENITGLLVDDLGNELTSFQSYHLGMGMFYFIPRKDRTYSVICTNGSGISKRFNLPQCSSTAQILKVMETNETINVAVQKHPEKTLSDSLFLIIHSRGNVLYTNKWDMNKAFISFDKKKFPSGVLQILLLDSFGNSLSERLVFCLNDDQAKVSSSFDKKTYRVREKVALTIDVADVDNRVLKGNFSVAVTDNNIVPIDTTSNILTSLLLSSELKGYIEAPASYFNIDSRFTSKALNILMLTQGWRRYEIPDVVKGKIQIPTEYLEIGQEISGCLKSVIREKPVKNGTISILATNRAFGNVIETDENGQFNFNGFDFPDSTKYVLQAFTSKGSRRLKLFVDEDLTPLIQQNPILIDKEDNMGNRSEKALLYTDGIQAILLEEVQVVSKNIAEKYADPYRAMASRSITADMFEDMGATSFEEVLRSIPNVSVNSAVFIDGVCFIESSGSGSLAPPPVGTKVDSAGNRAKLKSYIGGESAMPRANINDIVSFQDVERIDYIREGGGTAIFGTKAAHGVIMITTKKGEYKLRKAVDLPNICRIMPLGFQRPIEFYSPKYASQEQINNTDPDLRATIYWNPNIKISEQGTASFDFYTADIPSTYTITLEGISSDGKIIRTITNMEVMQ